MPDTDRFERGRPKVCAYCDGHGNSKAGGECGFCDKGKPLDTQEDWDNSWGAAFKLADELAATHSQQDRASD